MIPKTLAILITEETYPIAFACLPIQTFGQVKPQNVIDNYFLVINKHTPMGILLGKSIVISNTYVTRREFYDQYEEVNEEDEGTPLDRFFEVRAKK